MTVWQCFGLGDPAADLLAVAHGHLEGVRKFLACRLAEVAPHTMGKIARAAKHRVDISLFGPEDEVLTLYELLYTVFGTAEALEGVFNIAAVSESMGHTGICRPGFTVLPDGSIFAEASHRTPPTYAAAHKLSKVSSADSPLSHR